MKRRFRITYRDPETDEWAIHNGGYEDTPAQPAGAYGNTLAIGPISARSWAEDHAYSLADKGPYRIDDLGEVRS